MCHVVMTSGQSSPLTSTFQSFYSEFDNQPFNYNDNYQPTKQIGSRRCKYKPNISVLSNVPLFSQAASLAVFYDI